MPNKEINIQQICSVKTYLNLLNNRFEYRKGVKFLFLALRKEGFYDTHDLPTRFITVDEIQEDDRLICKDKEVYFKLHLEIKMSNGNIHSKYFENQKELDKFKGRIINFFDPKWINV